MISSTLDFDAVAFERSVNPNGYFDAYALFVGPLLSCSAEFDEDSRVRERETEHPIAWGLWGEEHWRWIRFRFRIKINYMLIVHEHYWGYRNVYGHRAWI